MEASLVDPNHRSTLMDGKFRFSASTALMSSHVLLLKSCIENFGVGSKNSVNAWAAVVLPLLFAPTNVVVFPAKSMCTSRRRRRFRT
jgi:hypothetical protein